MVTISGGSLLPLPSPIASANLPACAGNCAEIARAYVSCAKKSGYAVNDCFCTILSWPTTCASYCPSSDDLVSLAAWYWDVCPYEMDRKLGQVGISRWLSHGPTIQAWAIATTPTVAELKTGYGCYHSSQLCVPTSTSAVTSTNAVISPTAKELVEPAAATKSTSPPAATIVLGVFIPLLIVAIGIMIIVLLRRRRQRRRSPDPPPCLGQTTSPVNTTIRNLIINNNPHSNAAEETADIIQQILVRLDVLQQATNNDPALRDALKELLTCSICFEIFHRPVCTINPATYEGGGCLHTFCGACATRLVREGPQPVRCPQDNITLTSFNDHRLLSEIYEEYLNKFPEDRRSAADIVAMNELYTVGARIWKYNTKSIDTDIGSQGNVVVIVQQNFPIGLLMLRALLRLHIERVLTSTLYLG
ncbi:hypothetical protein BGZ60DRAFT_533566 [Tricladium varicosporioides]|nr:hypothetical protein BGZ60DRAFT_533566 [Hymenoscyphus varicosporioides]